MCPPAQRSAQRKRHNDGRCRWVAIERFCGEMNERLTAGKQLALLRLLGGRVRRGCPYAELLECNVDILAKKMLCAMTFATKDAPLTARVIMPLEPT